MDALYIRAINDMRMSNSFYSFLASFTQTAVQSAMTFQYWDLIIIIVKGVYRIDFMEELLLLSFWFDFAIAHESRHWGWAAFFYTAFLNIWWRSNKQQSSLTLRQKGLCKYQHLLTNPKIWESVEQNWHPTEIHRTIFRHYK